MTYACDAELDMFDVILQEKVHKSGSGKCLKRTTFSLLLKCLCPTLPRPADGSKPLEFKKIEKFA